MLYDLLDNFAPVFKVKLWVFFLAYYVHLGSLEEAEIKSNKKAVKLFEVL